MGRFASSAPEPDQAVLVVLSVDELIRVREICEVLGKMGSGANVPIITRSPVAVPGKTGRTPWSTILLQDWAALKYPQYHLYEQMRLGPTSSTLVGVNVSPALEAMLRVNNWYADGVIALPNEVLFVESKMQSTPGAISQVKFYVREGMRTPALQNLMAIPFIPVVLFAESDNDVNMFARQEGVRVEIYTPSWISDYLTQVQFRNRVTVPSVAQVEPA
jgi:hypothetical protein